MKIECPECGFGREVPGGRIPANAEVATCPKCKAKFRFRSLDGSPFTGPETVEYPPGQETGPEEYAGEYGQDRETEESDWDETLAAESSGESAPEEEAGEYPEEYRPGEYPTEEYRSGEDQSEEYQPEEYREEEPESQAVEPVVQAAVSGEDDGIPDMTHALLDEDRDGAEPLETDKDTPRDIWQSIENIDGSIPPKGPRQGGPARASRIRRGQRATTTADDKEVPWERLDHYGFYSGLYETLRRALFFPKDFFRFMPLKPGLLRPLAFYVLLNTFSALMFMLWTQLQIGMGSETIGQNPTFFPYMNELSLGLILSLVLFSVPVFSAMQLFLIAGVYHLLLKMFQADKGGFEATFRTCSYASAAFVAAVIPFVGLFAAFIWNLVITYIGLRETHKNTNDRVILAFVPANLFFLWLVASFLTMQLPQQ